MIFGVDLGTTNSLIAYLREGVPVAISNAHGTTLTPSVVGMDESGAVLVGAIARERLYKYPDRTVASFKRLMGSQQSVKLGGKEFRPEDLSALILRSLKADAEAVLGVPVDEVVISVPAYFNDQQRKATRLAGELAGLTVKRLVNEPTAAALFHGIRDRGIEAKFLIFDLGGGTFDVSILEQFEGIMEVRATGGDSFLGGDDFSERLVELIFERAGLEARKKDPKVLAAVRFLAEQGKRRLTDANAVELELPVDDSQVRVTITQEEYEQSCGPLLDRLRSPVERALRDARLRAADLNEVVLVGGATRMPMVRKLVAQLFARLPARYIDPDQTIALGAAVCAGLVARDTAFEEIVLTDVCPHTLGTEVSERDGRGGFIGDVFLPIIERNTVVPASRVRSVTTLRDGQAELKISIFQGESRECSRNVFLGEVTLKIPPRRAGEINADIRYTYDINGILDVDITVEKAGISKNLVIKKLAGDVSDGEIERRRIELAALKVHPRAQEENRLLVERADRVYAQLLGEEREQVGRMIGSFSALLERQDPEEIAKARVSFSAALDSLERGDVW
jgi:molecular chaperone HscC